jgi:hypothetical protein
METKTDTLKDDLFTPITLSSPVNFPDDLKKFTPIYFIIGVLFSLLSGKDFTYPLSFILGASGGFLIVNILSTFKVCTLRNKLFVLEKNLTKEELANLITLPLTKLNMNVEILSDSLRVIHNNIEYDIFLSPDENTFRIWPQNSILSRFLTGRVYIYLYKKAIFAMPIIAYTIQADIKKSLNENFTSNYEEQISSVFNSTSKNTYWNQKKKFITFGGVIAAVVILFLLIVPRQSNQYIHIVKNGTLNSYKSITVGKAFEDFFTDTDWKYFSSDNKKDIVEFTGTYHINEKKYKTLIQFTVNKDNSEFEMNYFEVNGKSQTLFEWSSLLSNIYEDQ